MPMRDSYPPSGLVMLPHSREDLFVFLRRKHSYSSKDSHSPSVATTNAQDPCLQVATQALSRYPHLVVETSMSSSRILLSPCRTYSRRTYGGSARIQNSLDYASGRVQPPVRGAHVPVCTLPGTLLPFSLVLHHLDYCRQYLVRLVKHSGGERDARGGVHEL